MASDNRASFARIGFTVIIGVVAIAAALVFLGGLSGQQEIMVESYFDSSAHGLSVGSPVNFRGVKVGEVRKISFIGTEYYNEAPREDYRFICVYLAIFPVMGADSREVRKAMEYMVSKGLHATISASGITGLSRIELNYPKGEIDDLKIRWVPRNFVIPSSPSLLEGFSEAAVKAMNQINQMDFLAAWTNMTSLVANTGRLVDNANHMLENQQANVADVVNNVNSACQEIRELAVDMKQNPSMLLRPNDPEMLPETAR